MSPGSRLAIRFVETYRARVAHRLRARCRFQPNCSEYALAAYGKYGFLTATRKSLWRVLRCNPWNRGPAVDPP